MIYYLFDERQCSTGQSVEQDIMLPVPIRSTSVEPPETPVGKYAQWQGFQWVIIDTYPAPPAPAPTETITPRQCRLQLLSESLLDDIEAAISTMPQAAQIEWEYALEIKRTYDLVSAMQALLGKDDAEMDTFFVEAGKL